MEHHITFTHPDSKGQTMLLRWRFDLEVDFYEVEHQHTAEDGTHSGWVTRYFRTVYPLDAQDQQSLSGLPDVEEYEFNQR